MRAYKGRSLMAYHVAAFTNPSSFSFSSSHAASSVSHLSLAFPPLTGAHRRRCRPLRRRPIALHPSCRRCLSAASLFRVHLHLYEIGSYYIHTLCCWQRHFCGLCDCYFFVHSFFRTCELLVLLVVLPFVAGGRVQLAYHPQKTKVRPMHR